jgi:hypothetical protein
LRIPIIINHLLEEITLMVQDVTGSGSTKITKPRSTGRTTTVNPPTTRTTGRSSTVKSNGGSSNTRSTGRTTTKKKTRTE